ncbi:MAG TPA: magnesium/cobalt transporter CorA [Nitrospiria bacterium]|nr:magnesium/cobalt transporter CorA [Nitrospiria bacterium]
MHIGTPSSQPTRIQVLRYGPDRIVEEPNATLDQALACRAEAGVAWINVDGVQDVEVLKKLGEGYGLHPLVIEDIANTEQRPKLEDYGDHLFIVLKMLSPENGHVRAEQVSVVITRNVILSFQEHDKPGDCFDPLRARLRADASRLRSAGADFLAYGIVDALVDNYFVVLEQLGDAVEHIEEAATLDPTASGAQSIHVLRRELLVMRRAVWPLRDLVAQLLRRESTLIGEKTAVYLRDVYDHLVQVIDTTEALRDLLSSLLEVELTRTSLRMNETMKALTLIATVFIPLTFIVGVYGMNFQYMPELRWRWAYPTLWALMIALGVGMVVWFKRKRWL